MLEDARRFGIPATIRGLVDNDFRKTASMMFELSKKDKQAGVQIDPTLFRQYGIKAVPALVVTCGAEFDVIYGSLELKQALKEVQQRGDCAGTAAQLLQAGEHRDETVLADCVSADERHPWRVCRCQQRCL